MATKEEVTEMFDAKSAEGDCYQVVKVQTFVSSPSTTGHGAWKAGSYRHELSTGESVNQISETEFEILWLDREDNEIIVRF